MGKNGFDVVRELVQLFVVFFSIAVTSHIYTLSLHDALPISPNWKEYGRSTSRLQERIQGAKSEREKEKLRDEKDRLDEEKEGEERDYYQQRIWDAYPVGLVDIVLGTFFAVQAVGAGLMFGGL